MEFLINFIEDFRYLIKNNNSNEDIIKQNLSNKDGEKYELLKKMSSDYIEAKNIFINNLKSLNIDIIYKYNKYVKKFSIGDKSIEIGFIIEFYNIDNIFNLIKDNLKKQNNFNNFEEILYNTIYHMDKVYINLNKYIHIINLNINLIHLTKILTEKEDDTICNICMNEVDNKLYINIETCKICSFKYCNNCIKMIDKCSACNNYFSI